MGPTGGRNMRFPFRFLPRPPLLAAGSPLPPPLSFQSTRILPNSEALTGEGDRDGAGDPREAARGGGRAPAAAGGGRVGVEGVRGGGRGERRRRAGRRARRVRRGDQGRAARAQDHLHREEGHPRRDLPQRRVHPVQGSAPGLPLSYPPFTPQLPCPLDLSLLLSDALPCGMIRGHRSVAVGGLG